MNKSESIKELATALAKFQEEVTNPKNTADNPFFKSKYAPLNDVLSLVRPILSKNGLSLLQSPSGDGEKIIITSMLMHSSGEWIELDPLMLKADKVTAQGAGSAITYGRRYAVSAILGISSEDDDDGNGASGDRGNGKTDTKPKGNPPPQKQGDEKPIPINWAAFWSECKKIGYTQEQVHAFAKTDSIKTWKKEALDELYKEMRKAKTEGK